MESNKILPAIYKLEEKYLIPDGKFLFSPFNSRLNIKIENEINSPEERSNFAKIYSKFKKQYRYKKRLSYDFDNFRVDITLVKFSEGQNILLSDIDKKTESIELEIEYTGNIETLSNEILLEMLNIMVKCNQINNEGYFNISLEEKKVISKNYLKLIEKILKNKKTIGPKPLALTKLTLLTMLNVFEENDKTKDLKNKYLITEKADGERYFMFIKDKKVFLINDNLNVIKTGLELETEDYNNSILDGELMNYINKDGKYIYEYRFFDFYIKNYKEIYTLNLNKRIEEMEELNNLLVKANKYIAEDINLFINCVRKEYYPLEKFKEINDSTKYNYHIDGVIFMPTLPLSDIENKTYDSILKYKPLEENTIDVLVQDSILYCNYRMENESIKSEIMCTKPYIVDLHKKSIKQKTEKGLVEMDKTLLNNKIVEIVYDINEDCFIYNRIRHDKTQKYNTTGKIAGTANAFHVINDIMGYTFNSLTEDDIMNLNYEYISNLKIYIEKMGSYYKTDDNRRKERSEIELRKLQNKVKEELIYSSVKILEANPQFSYIKTYDIGCGRGGDLNKYINTNFENNRNTNNIKNEGGIQFILGTDIDSKGIEYIDKFNKNLNARGRFLLYKNQYKEINKNLPNIYENSNVYYFTSNIYNLDKSSNNIETNYNDIIENIDFDYGENLDTTNNADFENRSIYDKKMLDEINIKYKGKFNLYEPHQFELISCQFAIHYFDLEQICKYIDLQLKPGGLFICTYMEKNKVEKLFEKREKEGKIINENEINGGSKSFWSLRKTKDNYIDVHFNTMGQNEYKEEKLISLEELENNLSKYNISLYDESFSGISNKIDFEEKINNISPEYDFNKLYTGVIFQKNDSPELKKAKLETFKKGK